MTKKSETGAPGKTFLDAPIVQSTLSSFKTSPPQTGFTPAITHRTSTMSNWRNIVAMDSVQEKTSNISKQADVFKTKAVQPPVEDMKRSFNDYEAYRRDMNPGASAVDYRNFLSSMQGGKRSYDSNISSALEYNRRVLAYKCKEQGLRAAALKKNTEHDIVQKDSRRAVELKQGLEQSALTETKLKLAHEMPNYNRSSHHYVSALLLLNVRCRQL